MKVLTVPGGTALLREPAELRIRDRRKIESTSVELLQVLGPAAERIGEGFDPTSMEIGELAQLGISGSSIEQIGRMQDVTILAYLLDWDLKDKAGEKVPLPNLETIGDLAAGVYDALAAATADLGPGKVDFDPPDPTSPGFESSPTEPSGDSEPRSGGSPEPELTEPSSLTGESSSSDALSPA